MLEKDILRFNLLIQLCCYYGFSVGLFCDLPNNYVNVWSFLLLMLFWGHFKLILSLNFIDHFISFTVNHIEQCTFLFVIPFVCWFIFHHR